MAAEETDHNATDKGAPAVDRDSGDAGSGDEGGESDKGCEDDEDGGGGGEGGDGGDDQGEGDDDDDDVDSAPKAGNQPKFKGESAKFLRGYQYRYDGIRRTSVGKVKGLRQFWHDIYKLFWDKFTLEEIRALWGKEGESWNESQALKRINSVSTRSK